MDNFDPYNVLLSIATNIAVLLMTAFVLQGHFCDVFSADAPVIVSRSSCVWDGTLLSCCCIVDSNPRPAVTWSVNGTQPPDGFNASFSYVNQTLTATLRGISDAPQPVECHAVSALGNHSLLLLLPHHGTWVFTIYKYRL